MTETFTLSARRGETLFREVPNAERNRQADHDHVDHQALNQVVQLGRTACVKLGERQDDQIHDQLDPRAVA
jgi:hypothetical protein